MQYLTVDRLEGTYVICEDKDKKLFAIERTEAPAGVKEGDVLRIDDDGTLSVDTAETDRRRAGARKKQSAAFRR
ncbi:MAG: DUF3006 domain-containing protein [Clostridia bacterium]|nr:DUF3006 domain-containing protein [Clostridia bacterium]